MTLGVKFSAGEAAGIGDPILLNPPINGLLIQHWPHKDGLQPLLMDCAMAEAIYDAAPILKRLGVTQLLGARSYKFRCIAPAKDPPTCSGSKLSLHAHATALDIGGVMDQNGNKFWVEHDWQRDPVDRPTCDKAKRSIGDQFLHDVICALFEGKIFSQHLTPNFDTEHKTHWHVDLSTQERFLR